MPDDYIIQVKYNEARELASWISIFQDMSFAVDSLIRLLQLLHDKNDDSILMNSLFISALISYGRCFTHGKRQRLSEDIFRTLPGEGDPLACHRFYKNMRDKHIAHSVNPFEQVKIGLVLSNPESTERKVRGIANLSAKLVSFDIDGVETLLRLALFCRDAAQKQMEIWTDKTVKKGEGQSVDNLYSNPRLHCVIPEPDAVNKARLD